MGWTRVTRSTLGAQSARGGPALHPAKPMPATTAATPAHRADTRDNNPLTPALLVTPVPKRGVPGGALGPPWAAVPDGMFPLAQQMV
jgi:hypothetical protein